MKIVEILSKNEDPKTAATSKKKIEATARTMQIAQEQLVNSLELKKIELEEKLADHMSVTAKTVIPEEWVNNLHKLKLEIAMHDKQYEIAINTRKELFDNK